MSSETRVCVEDRDGQLRKIALIASNRSGFYVSVPYHKSRKGFFWRNRPTDRPGVGVEVIRPHQMYCASSRAKLSFHPPNSENPDSFLIHFSGAGIKSGFDAATGKPKGLSLIGPPIDEITTGPTFGIVAHGLHDFDVPRGQDRNCLVFPRAEMIHCEGGNCGYNLEFFLYRNSVRRSRFRTDKYFREYYYHGQKRGFYLRVIELPDIDRFLGVFCRTLSVNEPHGSGYTISSPRALGYNLVAMYPAPNWPATRSIDYADPAAAVS